MWNRVTHWRSEQLEGAEYLVDLLHHLEDVVTADVAQQRALVLERVVEHQAGTGQMGEGKIGEEVTVEGATT